MKNKLLLFVSVLCIGSCAYANLSLSDLTAPKGPAYRVGISEIPENQYVQAQETKISKTDKFEQKQNKENKIENNDLLYSELSIKRLSKEIASELEYDENDMVADLSLLWQGAAMQSDTINFALYKLANPDAEKPNKSTVKNMLKTIASMSTLVGAGIGNPLLAGSSLIGGNVLGIMSQDTKELNYKYSKVSDADMIILIRKVEDLQQNTVNLYYDYMNAKKQLDMTTKLAKERKTKFDLAQKNNAAKEIVVITDAYFRTALDKQRTARSEFLSKRAALEQFVGNETFTQFEQELAQRQQEDSITEQTKTDYNNTITNVENYTNSLNNKTASLSGIGYVESDEDKNLSKLENLEIQNFAGNDDLAENNDDQETQVSEQTTTKEKKVKKDPYDTKGLIFLHDKQPNPADYEVQTQSQTVQSQVQHEKNTNINDKKQKKSKKDKKKQNVAKKVEQTENISTPQTQTTQQKPQSFKGIELLPLDAIRVPDLKPNGYSIFSE